MPIYDYECPESGRRETRFARINDRHKQTCGICGRPLRLLLSAPMGIVKGPAYRPSPADHFTADMLKIPVKDLDSGIRTPAED